MFQLNLEIQNIGSNEYECANFMMGINGKNKTASTIRLRCYIENGSEYGSYSYQESDWKAPASDFDKPVNNPSKTPSSSTTEGPKKAQNLAGADPYKYKISSILADYVKISSPAFENSKMEKPGYTGLMAMRAMLLECIRLGLAWQ